MPLLATLRTTLWVFIDNDFILWAAVPEFEPQIVDDQ